MNTNAAATMPCTATDLELIGRCRGGDQTAYRALYLRHAPAISRLARHLGVPRAELDDLTQDVFLAAFTKLHRFREGHFGHWLARICAHGATDRHRRRRVREVFQRLWPLTLHADAFQIPDAALGSAEAERHVAAILGAMRPRLREVFALFELQRLPGDEIAQLLGCPAATVRTRLFHARRAFLRIGRQRGFIERDGGAA